MLAGFAKLESQKPDILQKFAYFQCPYIKICNDSGTFK